MINVQDFRNTSKLKAGQFDDWFALEKWKELPMYKNFGKARTGSWLFPLDCKTKIQASGKYQ